MTQEKDGIVAITPIDTPLMVLVGSNDRPSSDWTTDPLTTPKPYTGGWTEIFTNGKGDGHD
jgi:hypothetical protein